MNYNCTSVPKPRLLYGLPSKYESPCRYEMLSVHSKMQDAGRILDHPKVAQGPGVSKPA
jgi:hypothetical protein